jgi:nuclear pore complex protein Nup188
VIFCASSSRTYNISQITKISPDEPASTGTLLELCGCAVDILRHLSNDSLSKAVEPGLPPSLPIPAFSAKTTVLAASEVLETTLTYAVTQLAIWVEAAEHRDSPRQMELDDGGLNEVGEKRRRTSMGVSGLVRREEIAVELKTLLTSSKSVIEKARQQLKSDGQSIIWLLIGFLEKRVLVDT